MNPIWKDAPRYGPKDPWPAYAFVPGQNQPHPIRDPQGHSYGQTHDVKETPPDQWRQDKAYLRGIDLYHAGFLWEAHEAWESIWKASQDKQQRAYLRGLIQLAAALLKMQTDQPRGTKKLLARAVKNLADVHARTFMGIAISELRASFRSMQANPDQASIHAPHLAF